MNTNVGIQNEGVIAWDGLASFPRDIRKHARFGFSFEVTDVIAVDAVFNIQSAPPSDEDDCVAGDFVPVAEVPTCAGPAEPAAQATITIPAGTPVGTICAGTIPCRPDAFIQIASASGDTDNVSIVMIRQGPVL